MLPMSSLRPAALLAALILLFTGLLWLAPAAQAAQQDLTSTASADAYINEAAPSVAHGTTDSTNCVLNDDSPAGQRRHCRMRFVVDGVQPGDTILSAKVLARCKTNCTSSQLVQLHGTTANGWAESTITWANRNVLTGSPHGSDSTHTAGADSEFTVNAGTITGNGSYEFTLYSPGAAYTTGPTFHTKESTDLGPRLVVTVNRPTPATVTVSSVTCTQYVGDGYEVAYTITNGDVARGPADVTAEGQVVEPSLSLPANGMFSETAHLTGTLPSVTVSWAGFSSTPVTPPTCPDPPPPEPRDQARTAYVLQQVSSKTELNNVYASQIADAEATVPALNGFGLRMGWKQYATDTTVLDAGKAIADANGHEFAFRFMAGRHTPTAVLDEMGPNYYYTLGSGERVPKPFGSDGSAGNPVFEVHYRTLVGELLDWSQANDVDLLHLSWYAQDWAELNHGAEVRAAAGYSAAAWLEGHKRLMTIASEERATRPTVAVEWPFSGYGPLPTYTVQLNDHMAALFGAGSLRAYFQGNGWGPNGEWGAPDPTVEGQHDDNFARTSPVNRHGIQAIQPTTTWTEADIDLMLAHLNGTPSPAGSEAANASYFELYTPTVRGTSGQRWADDIAVWVAG